LRLFLNGAIKIVYTVLWSHYANKNVFSDRRNLLYDKSACLRCNGRSFHSPGPAAAKCSIAGGAVCPRYTFDSRAFTCNFPTSGVTRPAQRHE